MMRQVTAAR